MADMFAKCSSLSDLNISNFNMKKVENKEKMFEGCTSLKNIDISKYQ
jgi:surface protein